MNRLTNDKRAQVINCLIEGCSIRSTVRMTGVAKKTVMRVLVEVGEVCADFQDKVFHSLRSHRLQLDEMWSWIYCKEKNRTEEIARKNPDAGDVWLWTAVDADTKLVPSWRLGQRDLATAKDFVNDLASCLSKRVQITCGPQKPLRVEFCMTPGADSGLFLRLFQRTLFGVLALCEADLPCCHFEAFGSVTSAPVLLSAGNCCRMDCSS